MWFSKPVIGVNDIKSRQRDSTQQSYSSLKEDFKPPTEFLAGDSMTKQQPQMLANHDLDSEILPFILVQG